MNGPFYTDNNERRSVCACVCVLFTQCVWKQGCLINSCKVTMRDFLCGWYLPTQNSPLWCLGVVRTLLFICWSVLSAFSFFLCTTEGANVVCCYEIVMWLLGCFIWQTETLRLGCLIFVCQNLFVKSHVYTTNFIIINVIILFWITFKHM